MPNWCNNSITIKGPKAKIEALYQEVKGKGKMLDILRPMPQSLRETTSPTPEKGSANYKGPQPIVDGYDNWYDWAVNNWGTKWDVDTDHLEINHHVAGSDEAEINGWFDSAWAPPLTALDYYIEKNPDVSIRCMYYEVAVTSWANGRMEQMTAWHPQTIKAQTYWMLKGTPCWVSWMNSLALENQWQNTNRINMRK